MLAAFLLLAAPPPPALPPGQHLRVLHVDGRRRTYRVYAPPKLDRTKPAPLVVALHGYAMTSAMMPAFTGLNRKADREGFVVAYPDGTGLVQEWNAGRFPPRPESKKANDVAFIARVLDDVCARLPIDKSRVYCTGMSNGGMMSYRVANELSDRIAAVAPVAGTMSIPKATPRRPVPLMHIHCRGDSVVPYAGRRGLSRYRMFESAPDSAAAWAKAIGCSATPKEEALKPADGSKTRVLRQTWSGSGGAEVVLISIDGGEHLWPGQPFLLPVVRPVKAASANDLMWEFFKRHRLKAK